ncbi:MAG: SMI1/KNR4 family protein [Microcystaceae cyanobacterium]
MSNSVGQNGEENKIAEALARIRSIRQQLGVSRFKNIAWADFQIGDERATVIAMNLEKIKERLIALKLASPNEIEGCTHQEVIELEQQLGVKLPSSYQEFLLLMGFGAGQFLRGSDCFSQHLLDLQEAASELLEENHFPQSLPDDSFVFLMHQGYQFSFFRLLEGEDPPTYSYCEGETLTSFIKSHSRFSEFLATEIDLHYKYLMTLAAQ